MELYLLLLLLGGCMASANAGFGTRKLLAPAIPSTLRFKVGDYAGGAAKFLAGIDKGEPGKSNKIMRNSGLNNMKQLTTQLNMDRDM
jgi:hypothetical protein